MSDDRIVGLLGSLRRERMERDADERTRRRLEQAWTHRARPGGPRWLARRLLPALATLVLVGALGTTVANASGESPLYTLRVLVEDARAVLYTDPADRAAYLLALLDQRQAEAARLEAAGNALAAERVRRIERQTLAELRALVPQEPEPEPSAAPPPSATPPPATPAPTPVLPTATATPTPPAAPTPTAGVPTLTPRPSLFTARPTPTPTPKTTTKPTTTPAPSPFLVLVQGTVKNGDGTPNTGACVSLTTAGGCLATVREGTFSFTMSARSGQIVTVYALVTDATGAITAKASVSGVVRGTTLELAAVKLTKL